MNFPNLLLGNNVITIQAHQRDGYCKQFTKPLKVLLWHNEGANSEQKKKTLARIQNLQAFL